MSSKVTSIATLTVTKVTSIATLISTKVGQKSTRTTMQRSMAIRTNIKTEKCTHISMTMMVALKSIATAMEK